MYTQHWNHGTMGDYMYKLVHITIAVIRALDIAHNWRHCQNVLSLEVKPRTNFLNTKQSPKQL